MLGKIVSIHDNGFSLSGKYTAFGLDSFEGYVVSLDDGTEVRVGIDDQPRCCENWGHVQSEDDLSYFVGADLLSVDVVDEGLNVKTIVDMYEGSTMFVNLNTSKGLFQLAVYNDHNGYYSHEAVVFIGDKAVNQEYL